jgi:hypothetical protein
MTVKVMKDRRKNLIILTTVITIILLVFFFTTSPYFTTYIAHQISITVVTNSTTETTSATTTYISKTQEKSIKSLTYIKKGGVKGVYNILEISKPNEAIYTCIFSPRFGNRSFTLSVNESEVDLLFEKIIEEYTILDYNGRVYKARQIYDYFTYEIFSELEDGETIRVKWVDEWASEEPIPQNLIRIKEMLEIFIRQKTIPCE